MHLVQGADYEYFAANPRTNDTGGHNAHCRFKSLVSFNPHKYNGFDLKKAFEFMMGNGRGGDNRFDNVKKRALINNASLTSLRTLKVIYTAFVDLNQEETLYGYKRHEVIYTCDFDLSDEQIGGYKIVECHCYKGNYNGPYYNDNENKLTYLGPRQSEDNNRCKEFTLHFKSGRYYTEIKEKSRENPTCIVLVSGKWKQEDKGKFSSIINSRKQICML